MAATTCASTGSIWWRHSAVSRRRTRRPLTNGASYGYRVCAFDRAGSLSAGRTVTAEPEPGFHPPTGSVSINAGATLASSARVILSLSATDPSSMASVCLSNSKSCTHWVEFAASKPWTLASGEGIRSVNVWFRDPWGDASTAPVSDSIVVVTRRPRRWAR